MFAVVKVLENEKSVLKRIKQIFKKPVPKLERINVGESSFFYRLELYKRQIEDNPDILRELLGKCSQRVIFSGSERPENSPYFKTVKVEGYLQRVLINTALDLLQKRFNGYERLKLCFVDKRGEYSGFLRDFALTAGEITVVTDKPSAYDGICNELYEEYGLSVIMSDRAGELSNYDFTVSPQFNLNKLFNNTVIIKNKASGLCDVLKGHEVKLPESVKQIIPQSVNKLEFIYALYTYCGIDSLGTLRFNDFKVIESVK